MSSKPVLPGQLLDYQVQLSISSTVLAASKTQHLHADPEETVPKEFHLNDAGLFLITANISAPADQHQVSQESKGSSGVLLITANSSAATNQNHKILIRNNKSH